MQMAIKLSGNSSLITKNLEAEELSAPLSDTTLSAVHLGDKLHAEFKATKIMERLT